jgi:hypothetical protein
MKNQTLNKSLLIFMTFSIFVSVNSYTFSQRLLDDSIFLRFGDVLQVGDKVSIKVNEIWIVRDLVIDSLPKNISTPYLLFLNMRNFSYEDHIRGYSKDIRVGKSELNELKIRFVLNGKISVFNIKISDGWNVELHRLSKSTDKVVLTQSNTPSNKFEFKENDYLFR